MALVGYKFGTITMGTMVPHKFSFVDSVPHKKIRALRYGELENNRTKETIGLHRAILKVVRSPQEILCAN